MNRIADDYPRIAAELKRIEEEKAKVKAEPLPDVQPVYTGYGFVNPDYDPA